MPKLSTTPSLIWPRRSSGHPSGRNIDPGETTGLPGGPQAGPTLLRPLAKIGLNDDEDLRHPLLRAECNRSAHQKMDLGKPR